MLGQPRAVVVEGPDLDRAAGASARRQEAMPVGDRAGRHVLHQRARSVRRAADGERHDAAAVEKQQPADRPSEQQLALAVVEHRVPVHLLGKRQVAQHAGEQLGQRVHGALAAHALALGEVGPLRRFLRSSASNATPCLRAKPSAAGVGSPVRGERGRDRGPVTTSSRSSCRSAMRPTHAVRRRGVPDVSTGTSAAADLRQPRLEPLRELRVSAGQPGRRQFLDPDFDQQFSIHQTLASDELGVACRSERHRP